MNEMNTDRVLNLTFTGMALFLTLAASIVFAPPEREPEQTQTPVAGVVYIDFGADGEIDAAELIAVEGMISAPSAELASAPTSSAVGL